jgi:hypothetical protein
MPDYSRRSGHPQLRKLLLAAYIPGITLCVRCHQPITTLHTRDIHLDHRDDGQGWNGLAHKFCNEQAGGRQGAAITNARMGPRHARKMARARVVQPKQSRIW